ncbi:hypothetical protein DPEC_G00278890 [Dallia pectoralis]|uniref:Uncharacterized protein n=1 Tax=Dallia pectoralis TaxID=75939 RepID=A0ACC2FMB9_DALPE|nr:hypothetical protein DPEC_G00278890 [Dallia pectoralis]
MYKPLCCVIVCAQQKELVHGVKAFLLTFLEVDSRGSDNKGKRTVAERLPTVGTAPGPAHPRAPIKGPTLIAVQKHSGRLVPRLMSQTHIATQGLFDTGGDGTDIPKQSRRPLLHIC